MPTLRDNRHDTHHVWFDTPGVARQLVSALCGAVIAKQRSSPTPTCPTCKRILAEHDAEVASYTPPPLDE